jgi:hypothetical protein
VYDGAICGIAPDPRIGGASLSRVVIAASVNNNRVIVFDFRTHPNGGEMPLRNNLTHSRVSCVTSYSTRNNDF